MGQHTCPVFCLYLNWKRIRLGVVYGATRVCILHIMVGVGQVTKVTVWDVTTRSLADIYRRFERVGTCYFPLQSTSRNLKIQTVHSSAAFVNFYQTARLHIPEDCNLYSCHMCWVDVCCKYVLQLSSTVVRNKHPLVQLMLALHGIKLAFLEVSRALALNNLLNMSQTK